MMELLYVIALVLSALLSTVAVLTHRFNDNFLQRIGLCVVAFASCSEMYLLYQAAECCKGHNAQSLFIIGFALYLIGTGLKVIVHGPKLLPNDTIRKNGASDA